MVASRLEFLDFFPIPGLVKFVSAPKLLYAVVAVTLVYCMSFCTRRNIVDKHGNPIPPGPLLRYAFLGRYPERALHVWAQTYGPLFSLFLGNQLFMVISDSHIAHDLLVTNGRIFSSRKTYFVKNQTILRGRAITATPYDSTWRKHRRIAMQRLNPKAVGAYMQTLDYEAHTLLQSLFLDSKGGASPVNPANYAGRFALNNMLSISFGTRTDSAHDPLVKKAIEIGMEFMDLTGVWSNAIDFIEPLQWLPTRTRTRSRHVHDAIIEVYGAMLLRVKARMDAGEDVEDCLAKTLLLEQKNESLDWEDMCMLSAVFTLGGVHSTTGIILWFLALIPSHPNVQKRAHEELDRVLGRGTWPTAEDEKQLPYLRAVIKEVQRVHPAFLVPTPHISTEDFVYNGYYIPKGTGMVMNLHTIHRNEERYPNAEEFNPDRYLGDKLSCMESAHQSDVMMRDHWTFGAGRRICPGMHVAEKELWLAVSRFLWCFEISPLSDEPICLDEWEGESGRTPMPFRIRLDPRHENVASILLSNDKLGMH